MRNTPDLQMTVGDWVSKADRGRALRLEQRGQTKADEGHTRG